MSEGSQTPLVSVIVPAFDAARHLPDALESVLAQAYEPLEIIVVDDGSTDGTADVARRYDDVVLVQQANAGAAAARNAGVDRATGALLAFLDADDVWLPGKLHAQVAALAAAPEADGVYSLIEEFHSDELPEDERAARPVRPGHHRARLASGLLLRTEAFHRVGPFRSDSSAGGELIDWLLRADEAGVRFEALDALHVRRRIHDRNTGVQSAADERRNYVLALKRSLDRRREETA